MNFSHSIPRSTSTPDEENGFWTEDILSRYNLILHKEGGYFSETDRSPLNIPNVLNSSSTKLEDKEEIDTRPTSTTIYYLLTASRPAGYFHRNRSRTVHCLHEGRGTYIVLYPPRADVKRTAHVEEVTRGNYTRQQLNSGWTIEIFDVGRDVCIYQWLVEGNVYKCSFLRDYDPRMGQLNLRRGSNPGANSRAGLFISEVVSPGFEFADHNFLTADDFSHIFSGRGQEYTALLNPGDTSE